MNTEITCGSACVKYVLNSFNMDYKLNISMIWATELALALNDILNKKVNLLYYKSNLVKDYKKNIDSDFSGFKNLRNFLNKGNNLISKKLTKNELKKEIGNNKYVIFCVESSAFNNDISMNGGHYIIATSINNNDIDIINPRKDKYEIMTITIDKLILCTKNYGSWRILINN